MGRRVEIDRVRKSSAQSRLVKPIFFIENRCDGIPTMQTSLLRLRDRLGSDAAYFQQVYNYAFEFSRPPGQRSLGMF